MVTPAPQVPTGGEVPAHHEAQGGHDAQGNAHEAHHADEAHENELQEAPARDETAEAVTSSPEASVDEKPAHSVAAAHEEEEERGPIEETPVVDEPPKMNWYILKVQSNREESIREGLQRRVAVAGLERYFGDVIVPTEMVSEFKGGKKRVVKRKLYPGYLVVNMEINEETWFLVRETPGIGDFTGSAGKPTPMLPHEVSKIVAKQEEKTDEAPKLKINFNVADRVKINEGTFDNFEGEVDSIDEASGRVTVMINIFGRSTPVELEYWQIEAI
jgi:transcriptional antiterminator NusG